MFSTSIFTMIITLISRVLGLLRGTLVAFYFGSSSITDAYYSAFKISNFFRQLLGEGALGNVFIPLYHKKCVEEGKEKANKFIFSILNIVFLFSLFVALLMIIFSDLIISFFVVGFDIETKLLASKLLRIMSSYFIFISLAGMLGAILNNFGKFLIPASTSIFFNISIILSALLFSKQYGIVALAYGVVIGGVFQLLVVLIPTLRLLKEYSFKIDFKDKYLKILILSMFPMLVGVFARQINTMVDQFFASFLEAGVITALENATRIYLLPVGVFGVTIANIIFPYMAKNKANGDLKVFHNYLLSGINLINFFVIPSCVVLTLYSNETINLIFSYGKFSIKDEKITSSALFYYSLGLVFYVGVHILSKAYYSFSDNKRPAKYSMFAIFLNIVLNLLLIKPLGFKGLALSTALSSMLNFILLYYNFTKIYLKIELGKIISMTFKIFISSIIAYLVSRFFSLTIIKFLSFAIVYLSIWAFSLYKKKLKLFYL